MRFVSRSRRLPQLAIVLLTTFVLASWAQQSASAPGGAQTPARTAPANNSASIVIVLDNSRRAKSSLRDLEKGVAMVAQQFSSDHEVALMTAGGQPTLVQEFTGDTELITRALKGVRAVGTLDFYAALSQGVRHARSDAVNDKAAVIAFVNELSAAVAPPARAEALDGANKEKPVAIYIVALRRGEWNVQEAVQRVAVMSGGAAYAPAKPGDFSYIANAVATHLGAATAKPTTSAVFSARPLDSYTTLIVRDVPVVENKETREIAGGENVILKRVLVSRLQRAKVFPTIWEGGVVSDDPDPAAATASDGRSSEVEMLATVIGYRRGSRAKRQFVPPLGGAAKMKVQVILRDRVTKETLTTFVEEGSHSSGFLGGSDEKVQAEAMLEVSNKIVARLKKMKAAQ